MVEILARLSYRNIDDNRSATPKNTLRSLFRFWMPDTDAAIEQRMRALDGLVDRHPDIGWLVSLCVARRPRKDKIIPRCYRPQWRGDRSHPGRPATLDQDHRLVRKARDICLNWPMHTEKTLGDLVEGIEELDDPARQAVCDLLDRWWTSRNRTRRRDLCASGFDAAHIPVAFARARPLDAYAGQ